METYRANYMNGTIVPRGMPRLPDGSEIVITVLDRAKGKVDREKRAAWLDDFYSLIEQSSKEDFPEFERVRFREPHAARVFVQTCSRKGKGL